MKMRNRVAEWIVADHHPPLVAKLRTFGAFLVVALSVSSLSCADDTGARGGTKQEANVVTDGRAVILLTGFEPFGDKRPPNPSWEGIKNLDGQSWHRYRLVCKEMKVVWGSPLEQLQSWTTETQPVAIFSFGQGGSDSFAIESRASNERGDGNDNNNRRAASRWIVDGGPAEFQATLDCDALARSLNEKGYPTRVSQKAGRYLCEEALYSLEYVKSTARPDAAVLFCHVPPLGSRIGNQPVTPEYVQRFVSDLLETWYTLYEEDSASDAANEQGTDNAQPPNPLRPEVEKFVRHYFRSWSDGDMDAYGDCFAPKAYIQYLDSDDRLTSTPRDLFVAQQRDYQKSARVRATEVPESIEIQFEAKLARAVVYWKLTAGSRTEFGYDHFTLMKQNDKWQIVNLVFYATKRTR